MTGDPGVVETRYVKCRICKAGMKVEHAVVHISEHAAAGDLVRAASAAEVRELREAQR